MTRQLGVSEKLVWLLSEVGSNNFVIVTKVKGLLPESVLRQALVFVQKKHPLLNVHIELAGQVPMFVSSGTPEIPLRIVEFTNPDEWIQEANEEMNVPFNWKKGPLVRVVWLRSEQEHRILVTFHHAIGDAKAGSYFVRDLLSLSGEMIINGAAKTDVPLPLRPPSDELIPAKFQGLKGTFNVFEGGLRQGLMLTRQPKKIPTEKDAPPQHVRTCVIHRMLLPEATELMIARAREEKTSVHGLICAMMLKAIAQKIKVQEAVNLGCFSTINLRQLLSPKIKDEIGLYVSGISTFHRVGVETPFWNLAREVKTNLSRLLDQGEAFTTLMLQKNLLRKRLNPMEMAKQVNQLFLSATCVTNLGRLDISHSYGSLELQELHFCVAGNAFPGGGIGIAATTFKGQAVFNFLFGVPLMSRESAEAIVNYAVNTLEKEIGLVNIL